MTIIVKLKGGLGNQMFQYAIGRAFSIQNKTELLLDSTLETLPSETIRHYALSCFKIEEKIATASIISKFTRTSNNFVIKRIIAKLEYLNIIKTKPGSIKEQSFNFDKNILNTKGDIYLDGYWQSEQYFSNHKTQLLKNFQLKNNLSEEIKLIKDEIKNTNSISLHIRRGDYISNKQAAITHGINLENYYQQAIDFIASKIEKPIFYIFTDDPVWVSENIKLVHASKIISNSIYKDYEELHLMSQCQHNIIANSSFSWWGAWLNQNPNKIIIAPKQWFNDTNINTNDLLPKNWIKF